MSKKFKVAVESDSDVSGAVLKATQASGVEGGQIELAVAPSGTLSGTNVTIDIYGNKVRFFESGGTNRGAYIDLGSTGASVGTNLLGGTTGAMNYEQQQSGKVSGVSASGTTIVSRSFTTNGYPIQVLVTGDAENSTAGAWVKVQLYRDSTAIGKQVHIESSAASENVPFALTAIDTPTAGTYVYSLKTTSAVATGTMNFGETDGPVLTMIELSGPKGDTGATGASTLSGLTDVTITTPSDNNLLAYDTTTSKWIDQTKTEAGFGTASTYNVPTSGNAASGEVVLGSDTRLTDSRTANLVTVTAPTTGTRYPMLASSATSGDKAVAVDAGISFDSSTNVLTTTGGFSGNLTGNVTGDVTGAVTATTITTSGVTYFYQPAPPTTKTSSATLTIAELLTGIIVYGASGGYTATLPTGTNMDGGVLAGLAVDRAFRWSLINTSGGSITIAGNTGHTTVSGSLTVAIATSASFISRRTAANTWVTYRV